MEIKSASGVADPLNEVAVADIMRRLKDRFDADWWRCHETCKVIDGKHTGRFKFVIEFAPKTDYDRSKECDSPVEVLT